MRRNMHAYGLSRAFTPISNTELDLIVKTYTEIKPQGGIRYLEGLLRSHGIRLQKMRLLDSMCRHSGVGGLLRHQCAIQCRKYHSTCPNTLWHCDGHHKLILWGIIIHGFIGGFCRTVSDCLHCVLPVFNSVLITVPKSRSQAFGLAPTTRLPLSLTSFSKPLMPLAAHQGFEEIAEVKM